MGKGCSKLGLFTGEWWKPSPLVLGSQEFLKFPFKVRSQSRSLKPKTTNLARVIVRLKQTIPQLCDCSELWAQRDQAGTSSIPKASPAGSSCFLPAAGSEFHTQLCHWPAEPLFATRPGADAEKPGLTHSIFLLHPGHVSTLTYTECSSLCTEGTDAISD